VTLVTPAEVIPNAALTISDGHIAGLERPSSGYVLDLRDHLVYPGLLNAHEHLNGTWWPRVGPGRPYTNVYEWLLDLETSAVRDERQHNSVEDIYSLGMYRNLISGVTTVADHFWRIDGPEFYTRHPIRVLYEYGRTWTPRGRTAWGDDIPVEYQLAVRSEQPYIIHLAEGLDAETAAEMDLLLEAKGLGRNTMVVHGISLRPQDMEVMSRRGASVCWCPGSNLYLYERTADLPALLGRGVNVALGTDSTLTGSLNLLDEVRTARQVYRDQTGDDPSAAWLVALLTTGAAYALMLEDRRGRVAVGYEADLLVLPDGGRDPHVALIEAEVSDIALSICAGVPVYGDLTYRPVFEQFTPEFTSVVVDGVEKLIAGDPVGLLERLSRRVGRPLRFPFLPVAPSSMEPIGEATEDSTPDSASSTFSM
jgi:cytosine/adenosine deaminase-related metal-dependent hydrolase